MNRDQIEALLRRVHEGELSVTDAAERLRGMPFERLGDAVAVDHHRELRSGTPEVVLGEWKTPEQISDILVALARNGNGALATRVSPDKAEHVLGAVPGARYDEVARAVVVAGESRRERSGVIAVTAAGTSDLPVAEEAAVTAEFLGFRVDRMCDIGVAGLQRVVAHTERLREADVAIVVAGMEGALPSVVAGMIDRPVIAVPTSIGYGVGLGGYVAMLGMLSSCAPGIVVVNIDNGFGAAVSASLMLGIRNGA
jgi:hypothetical protein